MVGRAQASAIYLFAYYLGSSVLGTLGGYAWVAWGWTGVMLVSGGAITAAMLAAPPHGLAAAADGRKAR